MLPQSNHTSPRSVDTLRLSDRETQSLMRELNRALAEFGGYNKRDSIRANFANAKLPIQIAHPGGSTVTFMVHPRNISESGLSFIHGNFIHHNTHVLTPLRSLEGQIVFVEGKVVRCHLVHGRVHDVGVRFNSPVDLREFLAGYQPTIAKDNPEGQDSQEAEKIELTGKILLIEELIDDRELLRFQFQNMGVEMVAENRAVEAIEFVKDIAFDAIVTDSRLPDMDGAELVGKLREAGCDKPILVLTADDRTSTTEALTEAGATEIAIKPLIQEELTAVMARHLPRKLKDELLAGGVLYSQFWSDARMRPLIIGFLSRLENMVKDLHQAITEHATQPDRWWQICLDIKGTAGGYGFPQITQAAARLLQNHREGDESPPQAAECQMLEALCHAACTATRSSS